MTSRLVLVTMGAAPAAAGAVLPASLAGGGAVLCPFRAVTGLPCPFCGASRAFVAAGHLDGRWLDYGAVWVVVAVGLVLAGLLGRRLPSGRAGAWSAAAVVAVAWAWALAHAATIAPPA